MPSLIRRAAAEGWLRLGVAWRNDEPIAAQVWFVKDGVASIFKLAYDENFGRLSPGTVLTAHLMCAVIDGDCVSEVDFLTGDEAFKADWMSHRRPRYGLIAYNTRSVRGILGAARRKAVNATKELLVWATGSRDA
jgi:CelD/BcsL family acetyltransferase involved in cellulose biosynthesis